MLYTLTLSPSLDYKIVCDEIHDGKINHAHEARFASGGKGINVSSCLTALKVSNIALGFIGGLVGKRVEDDIKSKGVKTDFINIKGETRVNVKISSKEETAFNLDGPIISREELQQLYAKLEALKPGDILIMSGSVGMLHRSIYKEIITAMNKKEILCVLDASGVALKEGVEAKPFLIKPNIYELSQLVGRNVSPSEAGEVGVTIQQKYGVNYVLISLGAGGAVLISPDGIIKQKCFRSTKKVSLTVGAGDSLLAGFMSKLSKGESLAKCLEYGVASGCAACYCGHIPSAEEIEEVLR